MYVCLCEAVSDREIEDAIRTGCNTVEDLKATCRAGTSCGSCHEELRSLLGRRRELRRGRRLELPLAAK